MDAAVSARLLSGRGVHGLRRSWYRGVRPQPPVAPFGSSLRSRPCVFVREFACRKGLGNRAPGVPGTFIALRGCRRLVPRSGRVESLVGDGGYARGFPCSGVTAVLGNGDDRTVLRAIARGL